MATQTKEVFLTPPLSIAGCQLWLDAADPYGTGAIPSNGSSLLTWNDKSGSGNHATVFNSAVASPVAPLYSTNSINSLSVISMSGTSYFQGATNVNGTTLSCFFLGNCVYGTGGSSQQRILGLSVTGLDDYSSTLRPIPLAVISAGTQLLSYRNANMASATVVSGTNFIGCCIFDGTSNYMYKDGTLGTQVASSGIFTTSIYGVGSDAGTQNNAGADSLGTNCLVGKIGELMVFNTSLNTTQRQQIEGYLAWKWGLKNSLPSTHPYASVSPYQTLTLPIARSVTLKGISFLPTSVSGCSLWLDGADLTRISFSSGTNLSTWSDKSGFGNNCSNQSLGTTITYPGTQVNGLNTVNFTAGCIRGAFNGSSIINTTDVSIFIVTAETAPNDNLRMFSLTTAANYQDDTANTMLVYCAPGNYQLTFYRAGAMPSPYTVTQNVPFIYSLTQTSGTGSMWFNGGSNRTASITTSAFAVTNYNIGTQYLANQNYTGLMCEVVVYNSLLDTNKRQQMEGYLAWKWGLQGSLPGTHPYSSVSPSQTLGLPVSRATPFTSFIPTSVSGCQLWLDGNDSSSLVLSGSNVTQWRDKSASVNNATAVGVPTYRVNTVVMGGSAYFTLPGISANSTNEAFFMVVNWSSSGAEQPFFIGTTLNGGRCLFIGPGTTSLVGSSYNVANTSIGPNGGTPANTIIMVELMTSSLVNTVFTNGQNAGSPVAASYSGGGTSIIGVGFNDGMPRATQYLTGNIYEVVMYNTALTTTQRQQMEGYLAWKWGIQTSLPTTHPYYSTPYVPYSLPRVVTKASIQVWSPLRVSGTQLWLDGADSSTITGTTSVTQWRDKSGNSRHLGVGSGTTSYSSNAIQLNSSYMFVNSAVDLTNVTMFILAKTTGPSNQSVFTTKSSVSQSYNTLDGFGFYMDGTTSVRFYGHHPTGAIVSFATDTSSPTLFSYQSSGTSVSVWMNAIAKTGVTLPSTRTSTAQGFGIGAEWTNEDGGRYQNVFVIASIYEIIVFNIALSTAQRQQVEGYLAWKWGLRSSLPGGHPYINFPPSP